MPPDGQGRVHENLGKALEFAKAEAKLALKKQIEAQNSPTLGAAEKKERLLHWQSTQAKVAGIEATIAQLELEELGNDVDLEKLLGPELSKQAKELGKQEVGIENSLVRAGIALDELLEERRKNADLKGSSINKSVLTFCGAIVGLGISALVSQSNNLNEAGLAAAIVLAILSILIGALHPVIEYVRNVRPRIREPLSEGPEGALGVATEQVGKNKHEIREIQLYILIIQAGLWLVATCALVSGVI